MILIVGLGNPGKKFEKTRHNIGSRVVSGLSCFNLKNVVLKKPTTFMNESGKAVKKIIEDYKLKIENLIVIHDDLDLPLGKIKIVKNRGSAGHKGVQSIIDELGTKNFVRFRIGIKPKNTRVKLSRANDINSFVLQKFTPQEEKVVKKIIRKTCQAVKFTLKHGLEKAMQKYNA